MIFQIQKTPRTNNESYSHYHKKELNPYKQVTNNYKNIKNPNLKSSIPIDITNTYYQASELEIESNKKIIRPKMNNKRVNFYNYN